ncbi:MAG: glycerol-3-phosphate 1-O-acyltransferase PlsY [Deltaproteobacteria bacterium]|nr:glycerol-3-phosphate 1-O-acyltransferase PlsY [Deltaproteobacteria bacterium]
MSELLGVALISYLIGSVPWGYLLGRWYGLDVRRSGSGNIGATNVARSLGRRVGLLTLALDAAKGALPVLLAANASLWPSAETSPETRAAIAALGAVAGHVFSIFLRFQGGKGVATAAGALLALAPGAALIALAVFAALLLAKRIVSLASLGAVATAPVGMALSGEPRAAVLAGVGVAALIFVRHRDNLARLRAGTEPRLDERPRTR